ncbi:uncharacterized protein N0V89_003404 [Didymosphaeria variabile]|uniref:Apple domain-containing protein n=1 Tax=Didymosphaeria variabile TaxID=1932322 RepID=A0A9W9CC99_9PLEO|nr:uncharacterized protein N0V89_003404 [Didymosphaeria variabile]KAJ4355388.1 hypothetical protein N0V89_003404 [Didymosphaeria variabile]
MGNFFFKAPSTFALCADFCKNDYPTCKSFRYSYYSDTNSQYCEFFPDYLENFFIADDTQPYYYYDVDCAFPTYAVSVTETVTSTTTLDSDGSIHDNEYECECEFEYDFDYNYGYDCDYENEYRAVDDHYTHYNNDDRYDYENEYRYDY